MVEQRGARGIEPERGIESSAGHEPNGRPGWRRAETAVRTHARRRRLTTFPALVAVLALALQACSASGATPAVSPAATPVASSPTAVATAPATAEVTPSTGPSSAPPSASTGPEASASGAPSSSQSGSIAASASPSLSAGFSGPPATVRLALDWTPNTDHTGFYVARDKGWYADAGINLQLIPYTSTAPETLLAAGQADCGISFQDSLTFAVAAGAPIESVMAILQRPASAIAVLASSNITRPRDLDGKTYGGFGYPADDPTIKVVIRHDGGTGNFKDVTLNGSAYEALYNKQVDFTIVFTAWEGIEAQDRGIQLRYFKKTDYGFPPYYEVLLACNTNWLAKNPDVARRFVGATVQGFQFAAQNPDAAAAILIKENPGVFDSDPKLPLESARFLAQGGYYVNSAGLVGPQTLEQWTGFSSFLYREGLLTDVNGKPLTSPPDYSKLFTNDFLPGGP